MLPPDIMTILESPGHETRVLSSFFTSILYYKVIIVFTGHHILRLRTNNCLPFPFFPQAPNQAVLIDHQFPADVRTATVHYFQHQGLIIVRFVQAIEFCVGLWLPGDWLSILSSRWLFLSVGIFWFLSEELLLSFAWQSDCTDFYFRTEFGFLLIIVKLLWFFIIDF